MTTVFNLADVFELVVDGLYDRPFAEQEFAEQAPHAMGKRFASIDIACREAEGEAFAAFVAATNSHMEDVVGMDGGTVADVLTGRVDEIDATKRPKVGLEVDGQGLQHTEM